MTPTPAAPRWTVDDNGDLNWTDGRIWTLTAEMLAGQLWTAHRDPAPAFDALAQCVRDADTLRQARQLAARHADSHLDLDVGSALADLVDLLTQENAEPVHAAHTRTSTGGHGPDFCAECSAAAQDWVPWPCPATEENPDGH